ncbi:MAG: N-acetyltransferase [Chitinophagia bacterium]|nr:N-acetyltransferase [Chitinophagia bacterium]
MPIIIESPRLLVQELTQDHAMEMFRMDNDPEVHRYVGQKPTETLEQTRAVIEYVRQQYRDNGIGRWAVIDKQTGLFIGWSGFKLITERINGHIHFYDFGYRFTRSAWGRGICQESANAILHYGLHQLGFDPVYAMTDVKNGTSRHILEKLGFRYVHDFLYDGTSSFLTVEDPYATWYEWPGNTK